VRFSLSRLRQASFVNRYVEDWSPVSIRRFAWAQTSERAYWAQQDPRLLRLHAQYYYYAGFYEWIRHRALLNPFRIDPSRPGNFQLSPDAIAGSIVLDVGCGPMTWTLSLVHCATVHVVDPLVAVYQEIQPFGWEFFTSVTSAGAEHLPFDTGSINVVHCWNVLDHTQNADRILREIARVLLPGGQLLLGCDVRRTRGGGAAHPYKWSVDAFETRVFKHFEPVTGVALLSPDDLTPLVSPDHVGLARWVCRLQKLPEAR
jgi:SAM-dependent methyltransferase